MVGDTLAVDIARSPLLSCEHFERSKLAHVAGLRQEGRVVDEPPRREQRVRAAGIAVIA